MEGLISGNVSSRPLISEKGISRAGMSNGAKRPDESMLWRTPHSRRDPPRARSSCPEKKSVIERASQLAEACGIALWNQDEAGPSATRPQKGGKLATAGASQVAAA